MSVPTTTLPTTTLPTTTLPTTTRRTYARRAAAAAGALSLLTLAPLAGGSPAATAAAPAASRAVPGHAVPTVHGGPPRSARQPRLKTAAPSTPGAAPVLFGCQLPAAALHCYGPGQVQHAYQVDSLLQAGFTGKGRTIVIIDAYQSPTVRQDLATFSTTFGLPAADLTVTAPDGLTPFDPTSALQIGWASEISLDVQWAHAMAPGAKISLVLASSSSDDAIQSALSYAVDHDLGDVISQSFGEAESCYGVNADGTRQPGTTLATQHALFAQAVSQGTTVFAASGDSGSTQPNCAGTRSVFAASTPASDPLVTAVGGTKLFADLSSGAYHSERVWNEEATFGSRAVGGGGFSRTYARPDFQVGFGALPSRGVPDVSWDAAIDHGVLVAFSAGIYPSGTFFLFGGTSSGTPQWAALAAVSAQLNKGRLGNINPALYDLARQSPSAYHDITVGQNGADGIGGFSAGRSWDAASGLGTPVAPVVAVGLAAAR